MRMDFMQQHNINGENVLDRAGAKNHRGDFAATHKVGQSQG
jgi:hypothetical protein